MAVIDITDDSFREIYKENDIVVLDFWAVWCGPCHNFAPTFEAVAEKYPDIVFGKVDTENNSRLPNYFAIRAIPTLIVVREQLEVYRGGGMSEQDLTALIEQIKNADMDQVRKDLGVEEED